jgi:chorismate mutase
MPEQQSSDRALIDMRDERDHLSVQLSLLKDTQRSSPAEISRVQRELNVLERRIASYKPTQQ